MKIGGYFVRYFMIFLVIIGVITSGIAITPESSALSRPMSETEPEAAPEPVPEPEAAPEPVPEPEPEPAPAPAPSPCDLIINAYTSSGGSLAPEALRNQGGLGQDIAACLGIDLGPAPAPPADSQSRTPCEQVIEAVDRSQGPNPSREWLASQGGLGADYAKCKGIDLADQSSQGSPSTQQTDPSGNTEIPEVVSPAPQVSASTSPAQLTFGRPGVEIRAVVISPQQSRVTLASPLKRGTKVSVSIKRRDSATGKMVTVGRQTTQAKANGTILLRVSKRLRTGDVVSFAASGKPVAQLRLQ